MANNFKQALKELTGYDEVNEEMAGSEKVNGNSSPVSEDAAQSPVIDGKIPDLHIESQENSSVSFDGYNGGEEESVITKSMAILGDIESSDSVCIKGEVRGNVTTPADVQIQGFLEGDVKAGNIEFLGGYVRGDMVSDKYVTVCEKCKMIGDLTASNATIDGKIKGNINVSNSTLLSETSVIAGNVTTNELEGSRGFKISGNIIMKAAQNYDFDFEEEFN